MYNYQKNILILWPVHDTFVTSAESGKNVRLDMKATIFPLLFYLVFSVLQLLPTSSGDINIDQH